jgi:hypothetical protein
MTIDASDYNSGIDESISKLTDMDDTATRVGDSIQSSMTQAAGSLTEVQDAAESATSSLSDVGNVDMSGTSGSMNDLSAATSETTEKAGETVEQFSILDAIELAAVIEGVHLLADALTECVDKFAELNDISTRSAIFGGAGTSDGSLAGTTDAITKQAEAVGLKLGVAPEGVAKMEGVLKQYQVDTSKMSDDQIGQYVALARTTQQDPSAVATEVLKTAKAFNIDDTQKVIDVAAQAYGQTGFDFSSAQMSLSKMAGDQTQKALGGITGEIAILQDLQQTSLPSRGAGVALNKAVEDWQNSSDAYQTQVEKINAKGKVSYSTKDVAATGMTDTATGQSIFSEAGLNTTLEKNKTFMEAMGDLYTQGQAKGVDYFSKMSGGMYLEELAKNQAVIQGYKAENDSASGANDKLKNATDDLSVSLNRIGIAFDQVKTKIGSLLAGPAQAFADWITGPALSGITQIIDDIEKGDWDGAIQTIGDALGKIPGLVEKAIGDISIGDLLLKALGGAGGMIAGSDLVAMMGLPALIGGPMGALAGLAVGIIGTYLPQIITSFRNAVPGVVAEVNDWIAQIETTFSSTDFSKLGTDVVNSILSSISSMTSDATTTIVNLFGGINYAQLGWTLYDILKGAWDFAVGAITAAGTWGQNLWNSVLGSDSWGPVLQGIGNALANTFGPIFESIYLSAWKAWLEIGDAALPMEATLLTIWDEIAWAGETAFNGIIDAVGGLITALVQGVGGAVATAIGYFGDLVSAAGTAMGGVGSTESTSTGHTQADINSGLPSWITPGVLANAHANGEYYDSTTGSIVGSGDRSSSPSPNQYTKLSVQSVDQGTWNDNTQQFEYPSGQAMHFANEGTVKSPIDVSPSSPGSTKTGSGTWNDNTQQFETSSGQSLDFANAGSGNAATQLSMSDSLVKSGTTLNQLSTDMKAGLSSFNAGDYKFKVSELPPSYTDDFNQHLSELTKGQSEGWSDYYKEEAAFNERQLTALQSAKDAIQATGGDNKEALAKVDASIQATKTDLSNTIASAATATTTAVDHIPGLYYGTTGKSSNSQDYVNSEGGYVGPTKYYPGYKDQQLSDMAEAQAINSKYGINGLGSVSMKIDADTTPAEAKKATLESDVTSAKPILAVGADTTKAMADINKLITWVITSRPVMTVQVQITAAADEIQAQVEAAIRKAAS